MKRIEALEKIKTILFGEQKCDQAKTSEGSIVQWVGELSEGSPLDMVDTDGNVTPCPDGTITLEDGTKITCVGGLVTKLEGANVETEAEPTEEEMRAELKALKEKFADGAVPDLAAISTMVKALMNYCYGWEMQDEARKAAVTEAVSAYKSTFATIEKLVTDQDAVIASIKETIANDSKSVADKFTAIVELVEKIAEEPAEKAPAPKNVLFAKTEKTKGWETYLKEINKK